MTTPTANNFNIQHSDHLSSAPLAFEFEVNDNFDEFLTSFHIDSLSNEIRKRSHLLIDKERGVVMKQNALSLRRNHQRHQHPQIADYGLSMTFY